MRNIFLIIILMVNTLIINAQESFSMSIETGVPFYNLNPGGIGVRFRNESMAYISRRVPLQDKWSINSGIGLSYIYVNNDYDDLPIYPGKITNIKAANYKLLIPTYFTYKLNERIGIDAGIFTAISIIETFDEQAMGAFKDFYQYNRGATDLHFGLYGAARYQWKQRKKYSINVGPFFHYNFYKKSHQYIFLPKYFTLGISANIHFHSLHKKNKK